MGKNEKRKVIGSFLLLLVVLFFWRVTDEWDRKEQENKMEQLREMKSEVVTGNESETESNMDDKSQVTISSKVSMLEEYKELYESNNDFIGWLNIEGTSIDYPVMKKEGDEDFYLTKDFYGNEDNNGCLIMDQGSFAGIGVKGDYIKDPGTNLIIHGHHMRNGSMFGDLELFSEKQHTEEHPYIRFDTLYEKRTYELFAVFYSQVYQENDSVFKYYEFYNAKDKEDFYSFSLNCKKLSLFDTGVEATFGDEFITLSTCAYQTENGRFVVVGKRIF